MAKRSNRLTPFCWEGTVAFCSFAGGIVAAVVGSVMTALSWIVGRELHAWVRGVGTVFLILTIPMLIFSGYCLDWMEKRNGVTAEKSLDQERGRISLCPLIFVSSILALILVLPTSNLVRRRLAFGESRAVNTARR